MPEAEERIVRHLLTAIDDDAGVSQRKLSSDMGIAVGSVNWYLKRCVSKGLVKLQQVPMRRYAYYLTPKGFEEKARLTASFLQSSFDLYRRGRKEVTNILTSISAEGRNAVVLAGDGDLAEIAVLAALDTGVAILAITELAPQRTTCAGVPVVATLRDALASGGGAPGDILLTSLAAPRRTYARAVEEAAGAGIDLAHIHIPPLLNFRPQT
ncbi:MAG: winged helix-turn-helix transcriptional regulator [Pseudomonadota bacterium]|nr:winged helix-turn-helix transcriptional regulator [Pseudomonadota bacterium]